MPEPKTSGGSYTRMHTAWTLDHIYMPVHISNVLALNPNVTENMCSGDAAHDKFLVMLIMSAVMPL